MPGHYGLAPERCNSIANTQELHLSCTKPINIMFGSVAYVIKGMFISITGLQLQQTPNKLYVNKTGILSDSACCFAKSVL